MLAVVEVELVGGESFWVGLAGPALIAIAAVIAAIVAARTANQRQAAQLWHDLEARREEHVRDALDLAVEQIPEMLSAVHQTEFAVEGLEARRPDLQATIEDFSAPEDVQRQAEKALAELKLELASRAKHAHEKSPEMLSASIRLNIRLGDDSELADAHEALFTAWDKQLDSLGSAATENRNNDELASYEDLDANATAAYSAFYAVCRDWLKRP